MRRLRAWLASAWGAISVESPAIRGDILLILESDRMRAARLAEVAAEEGSAVAMVVTDVDDGKLLLSRIRFGAVILGAWPEAMGVLESLEDMPVLERPTYEEVRRWLRPQRTC